MLPLVRVARLFMGTIIATGALIAPAAAFAGQPPIELRLATAYAEKGDAKALQVLESFAPDGPDESRNALVAKARVLRLLGRDADLQNFSASPEASSDPYVRDLVSLELAKARLAAGAEDEARQLLQGFAARQDGDATTCEARKLLLDRLWWHEEYDTYRQVAATHETTGCPCAETELKRGYIALRLGADLGAAASHFERAAATGESTEALEATAAARWVSILADVIGEDISAEDAQTRWQDLIRTTQGGSAKYIVAPQLARRTLAIARSLHPTNPEGALAVLRSVPADPVFLVYGAQIAAQRSEWSGEGLEAAGVALAAEQAALAIKKQAATALAAKEWNQAIALYRSAIDSHGSTAEGRDARLRLGYALSAGGKRTEAIAAFEEALEANSSLGAAHPFNLEALFRSKSYAHGSFYMLAAHPLDDPSAKPELAHHLDGVAERLARWREAAPADSPDAPAILLEEGGVLFEQAMSLKSPDAWARVRDFLEQEVVTHPAALRQTRATARLMILESHYREENYAAVGPLYEQLLADFPGEWKVLGTAAVFAAEGARFAGNWDEGDEIFRRARTTVPESAETFASLNFHSHFIFSEAWEIRFADQEEKVDKLRTYLQLKSPNDPYLEGNWRWAK